MAENVIPTKGNLISLKRSLAQAKLGFELLDRKRNVLMREMMKLIDESAKLQQDIGDTFSSAYKALQAKEAFMREHQREPDIVELAKAMDVPKEEVVFALDAILDPVSLFEPVFHDGADTVCVMDQVGDNKNTDENWLARIALREAIDSLSEREKRIIRLRFFEGRTQMEVAEEIHISQAQVSRLEKGALDHIRKQI